MIKENYFNVCNNILHIGGHKGQEAKQYNKLGLSFTFVEPIPTYVDYMRKKGYRVINKAVSKHAGTRDFYIMEFDERSSLKQTTPDVAKIKDKITVECVTLSSIQHGFDGLSIDAQGETYDIVTSGDISQFNVIICEASKIPRYENEVDENSIIEYIKQFGFLHIKTFYHDDKNIRDLIFIKEEIK